MVSRKIYPPGVCTHLLCVTHIPSFAAAAAPVPVVRQKSQKTTYSFVHAAAALRRLGQKWKSGEEKKRYGKTLLLVGNFIRTSCRFQVPSRKGKDMRFRGFCRDNN